MLSGEFADAETEAKFKASAKSHHEQEQKMLLGQLIVAMLFMHVVIYIQSDQGGSARCPRVYCSLDAPTCQRRVIKWAHVSEYAFWDVGV